MSHICFSSQLLRLTSLSLSGWQIVFWRTILVPELCPTIMFIICWDFLMVQQILFWPEGKQSVVISNKLIYTSCLMSCQRTKDLGSKKIRKYQENLETSYNYCLVICPPPEIKILSVLVEISSKNRNWTFPIVRYFTWK